MQSNLFIKKSLPHILPMYPWNPVYSKGWKDPLQTTTCLTGDSKESTLFYSTNPFNLSWETNNPCCGLHRIPCHTSGSLQRVLPEIGWGMLKTQQNKLVTLKVGHVSRHWPLPIFIWLIMFARSRVAVSTGQEEGLVSYIETGVSLMSSLMSEST